MVTALVAALCLFGAAPAYAAADAQVLVPVPHPATEQNLAMLDADNGRWALAAPDDRLNVGKIWNTVDYRGLSFRTTHTGNTSGSVPSDLSGDLLRWGEPSTDEPGSWLLHTTDVSKGTDTVAVSTEQPVAWTPHGWIGFTGDRLIRHTTGADDEVLLTGIAENDEYAPDEYAPDVQADDDVALVKYRAPVTEDGTRERLVLIGNGPTRTVAISDPSLYSGEALAGIVLTPHSVVWSTINEPIRVSGQVYRQSRAGGKVSVHDVDATVGDLAATDDQIAVVSARRTFIDGAPTYLSSVRALRDGDSAWREITLPTSYFGRTGTDRFGGLATDGTMFVVAIGGTAGGEAGVYGFTDGDAEMLSPTYQQDLPVKDVLLDAGTVFVTGTDQITRWGRDLFSSDLTASYGRKPKLAVGEQELLSSHIYRSSEKGQSTVSVSGDHLVSRVHTEGRVRFGVADLENVFETTAYQGYADSDGPGVKVSGPYFLADHQVFRTDLPSGSPPLADLTTMDVNQADLYGSRLIWSTTTGAIRTMDVADDTTPRTLLTSGAVGPVAVFGTTVAWIRPDRRITVYDLVTRKTRQVRLEYRTPQTIQLGEGTLLWSEEDDEVSVLNLRAAKSQPQYTGLSVPAALDGHLIAGAASYSQAAVRFLPFSLKATYRPRLIAATAPATVDPVDDSWRPQFDLTAPVTKAAVKIYRDGVLIRTLRGEGPRGTVRGLEWDGAGGDGRPVPAGAYTWTFTARSTDGQGTAAGIDGSGPITGTVLVR